MGANASVYIEYDGSLEDLAELISEKLSIPKFWYKADQSPPHKNIAMCECLGFEIWLAEVPREEKITFEFEMETSTLFGGDVDLDNVDLSSWLVEYLYKGCDIKASPKHSPYI